jgi:hypothetical protein
MRSDATPFAGAELPPLKPGDVVRVAPPARPEIARPGDVGVVVRVSVLVADRHLYHVLTDRGDQRILVSLYRAEIEPQAGP